MSFKPRYILAQEAEERIVALFRKEKGDAAEIFNTAIDACQSIILDMYDNSSENVVPVVRCRDCKHRPTMPENSRGVFDLEFPDDECPCQCGDPWYNREPEDDWFCANGERSEDGET